MTWSSETSVSASVSLNRFLNISLMSLEQLDFMKA